MKPKNNKDANDKSRIEGYEERVIQLYDEKSTNFWRSLWIVIALGAFFFFIILLPFIMLQAQNYETNLQLNQTLKEIPRANQSVSDYSKVEGLILELGNRTEHGAADLRNYIVKSEIEYDTNASKDEYQPLETQQTISPDQKSSILSLCSPYDPKDVWMNCNVSGYLEEQFQNFTTLFNDVLPSELKDINDSAILPQISIMGQEIQRLSEKYNHKLSEQMKNDPQFWKTYTGKTQFYGELRSELANIWNNYGVGIKNNLNTKLNYLKSKTIELEDQRNITERNKAELSSRLEKLESPIGTIPIGVSESVVVYPIAIASGFAMYCYFFAYTVRLRKAVYRQYKKDNPNEDIDVKNKISLITPLWIEPNNSRLEQISKLAILLIPLALFIISWILISDSWSKILYDDMRTTFPYNKELYKQFYQYLYIFSLIFFAYGLFRICSELYNYDHVKKNLAGHDK